MGAVVTLLLPSECDGASVAAIVGIVGVIVGVFVAPVLLSEYVSLKFGESTRAHSAAAKMTARRPRRIPRVVVSADIPIRSALLNTKQDGKAKSAVN